MSLLVFENIRKEYKNQGVLKDVNLRIERGEKVALIGANGSGKTTLLRIATGQENCDSGKVIVAKNIRMAYLSQDMFEIRDEEQRNTALYYEKVIQLENKMRTIEKDMGSVIYNSEKYHRLMNSYSIALSEYEAIDGYIIEKKITKILMGLGLRKEVLSIPLINLSGGEKMRVLIARMILTEPDLIILDEPTNHLDINALEWLEEFLKKFEGGVLFVSHDRYFLEGVSTRIAELQEGTIIEKSCSYSNFIQQKDILRAYALKEQKTLNWKMKNINRVNDELKNKGKIRAAKSRNKTVVRINEELKKDIQILKEREHLKRDDGIKLKFKELKKVSKDIVWAEGLEKSFGAVSLFNGANFHIRGGERIGIIGANGCGKTTLIRIILGEDSDYKGFVRIGEWVKYSYLSQDINFQDEERTILEEILSRKEMNLNLVREHLSPFKFYGEDLYKKIKVLSGGEKLRLYLSCIILENSDCLILDEPTNHLDIQAREAVEKAIVEFKGTVIAISHDRYYLNNCVNRILEVTSEGKIISYNGNYDFYKNSKKLKLGAESRDIKSVGPNSKKQGNIKAPPNCEVKNKDDTTNTGNVENEIIQLEEKIIEFEESIDKYTPSEKYSEYSIMLEKVSKLYSIL
ncbi:ATP-binding cassette domain-containing protein [Clostridium sp. FP2]|uniref:ribosomal protection-like ABC-F family protein n=1 Tax=Clostridium TaxID=1485 RepID=UPI0013E98DBD|nr:MULTISPECIES: ABC-F family ATP-binding cassette domain-containing protein [Clostridium]MBW9159071.1 ATP-binding cassette domain-containing protein [Clostridium tagluense]MBZ9623540.1 ATP-binding cassette domain-containing protein [Clostridium sp. FP2]WLC67699.1 ATP-binding cassette domain-containing protein [Clostridium tagluense]